MRLPKGAMHMAKNHISIESLRASGGKNNRFAFVYGTLMQGERAAHLLADATYVGRCKLHNYAMYNLGRYPGILPCTGETVYGELYLICEEMVQTLDEYEEEGSLYDRKTVTVELDGQPIAASAYIYKKDVTGCPLMRKAWNDRT